MADEGREESAFKVPHFKSWYTILLSKIQKKNQFWENLEQTSKATQATDARSQNDYINTKQKNFHTNCFCKLFSSFNKSLSSTDFYQRIPRGNLVSLEEGQLNWKSDVHYPQWGGDNQHLDGLKNRKFYFYRYSYIQHTLLNFWRTSLMDNPYVKLLATFCNKRWNNLMYGALKILKFRCKIKVLLMSGLSNLSKYGNS